MTETLFSVIDFSLKWIIPLSTYAATIIYAITTVGKTERKVGALILGCLIFTGIVVVVIISGLEEYIPSIELKDHPFLVILFMLIGIGFGVLFVMIVNSLAESTENTFLAVTIALSLSTLFFHLYIYQIRIALGVITLGALIGVFAKLYAGGPSGKSGGNWRDKLLKRQNEN